MAVHPQYFMSTVIRKFAATAPFAHIKRPFEIEKEIFTFKMTCRLCDYHNGGWDYKRNARYAGYAHYLQEHYEF